MPEIYRLLYGAVPEIIAGIALAILLAFASRIANFVKELEQKKLFSGLIKPKMIINTKTTKTFRTQPSASQHLRERLAHLIETLEDNPSKDDVFVEQVILDTFRGRSQLLKPVLEHFQYILSTAKKSKILPTSQIIIQAANLFLYNMNDSQERLSLIGQSILENFSSELIDVIILADFSVPVSKVLKKLAEQYPQKRSSVRVFLISSTRHFISSQDTQKWRRLLAEGDLGRFYFLEDLVSYPNSGSLFNNLFQGNKKAVLLLGAERIYPDGKIVVFPGIRTLAKLALASNLPTIFVAETYKVQPLQGGDILGIGSDIENEEVELGYLELSDNLYLLTDHGLHVKETVNRFQVDQYRRNTFKCCARFWKNRIENKNYPIAIIFDLDGTLLDSEAIHEALYQEVAQKVGYLLSDDEYISKLRGKADEEIIGYIVKQTGEQHDLQQLISYKQKRYKEYLIRGDIPQTKGAIKFIESLAKMGFLLAICTSATSEEVKLGLGKIELFDYFDVIISAENMQQGKPAPEPYLMTAKTLGVLPKECLAYEDSVAGVQSAIAAGMQVVGINTTNIRALIASGAMCVIQDFQNYQLNEMTTR